MSNLMAVLLNGVSQIEYDRRKPLPDHHGAYLDRMDRRMDEGIDVDGRLLPEPDRLERARFVAAQLAHAFATGNEELAAAMTTYLAVRLEDLAAGEDRRAGGWVRDRARLRRAVRQAVPDPVQQADVAAA